TLTEQAFEELPEHRLAEFKSMTGIRHKHGWCDITRRPGGDARIRAAFNQVYNSMLVNKEKFLPWFGDQTRPWWHGLEQTIDQ
ncbi:MAG: hypothetical protein HQK56_16740, partial [Deltaproteobacteria bacterium]|nr:hypothetical protein [Deltaproteobacteria bacterium]